jgi:sugar lactone lactonase YvrE
VRLLGLLAALGPLGCQHPPPEARAPRLLFDEKVSYPEGPAFVDGKLYFVEYSEDTVRVWDGAKTKTLRLPKGSGPASVLPLDGGELLVACYDSNSLVRLNADGKELETIKLDARGPNDFVKDAKGGVYFSTSGEFAHGAPVAGRVYYLSPGSKTPRLVARDIHYANGLALIDKGKTLLVNEHLCHQILWFTVDEDGSLSAKKPEVWRRLADLEPDPPDAAWYTGPDGLKSDAHDNVYICQFGAGRLLVADAKGAPRRVVRLPYKYVTNIALGREDKVLYVTAARDAWDEKDPGGAVFEVPND